MIRIVSILLLLGLPIVAAAYQGDYVWEEKFKRALPKAESGNVDAQYDVAEMYEKGKGTDKNQSQAFAWYSKAAQQGDVKAAYKLGVAYLKGNSVDKDFDAALKWLKVAAGKDYARAHYYLGEMYEKGLGVRKDYDEAITWYKKSKAGGYALAEERINMVKETIDDEARERAAEQQEARRRAEAAANAEARKRLSSSAPTATKVSRQTPAEAPRTPDEILLQGGWSKRNKPSEFLPSAATTCNKSNNTIECISKEMKRNIGMADITYTTKAIIYSIKATGQFKISYRNNVTKVTVTDPEFIESGAEVPVKAGWQDAEHKLECDIENERAISCKKNKLRKMDFIR